jgi:ParB-like chromosome segregation protein Spo0J
MENHMAKKPKKPPAGGAPEKPDPGPLDAKQPAGGEKTPGTKPAKKKPAGGSQTVQEGRSPPPEAPSAALNGKVEWRNPATLKHQFASAVRKHTPEEERDLRASIAERGILQPLLITPDGEVIEGNTRARIARESKMTVVPCIVVAGLDDEEAWGAAVTLNADRRHLTREQKEEAINDLLNREPGLSDREIAKQTHTSHGTVAKKRKALEVTGQIPQSEERHDRRGARPVGANRKTAAKKVNKTAKPSTRDDRSADSGAPAHPAPQLPAQARRMGRRQKVPVPRSWTASRLWSAAPRPSSRKSSTRSALAAPAHPSNPQSP